MGIAGPLLAPHPSTFPIASALSLRNSGASIMGLNSPYLGDLNGFSSLNPSSSLMAFCFEVLTLFTADPLRPAMGNVPFFREIKSPHVDNLYTQLRLTCLSLLLCFFFHFLSSVSPYLASSLKHTCAFIFICVQTWTLSNTHLDWLLTLISHMCRLTLLL